jgi:hypothetical protein
MSTSLELGLIATLDRSALKAKATIGLVRSWCAWAADILRGGTGWQSTVDQDTIRNDSLFNIEGRDRDVSSPISGLPGFWTLNNHLPSLTKMAERKPFKVIHPYSLKVLERVVDI